jgi:hypothetical protein
MSKNVLLQARVISLSEGFGALLVKGPNIEVEVRDGGKVIVRSGAVEMAPDTKIGALMPDGTVFAGISPDTGRPMYATPKDVPLTCTFERAAKYAKGLDAHGHTDWRVPTKAELNVLFQNCSAIGGFNTTGSSPAGWYWSSLRNVYECASAQRFSNGLQFNFLNHNHSALRCVRG